MHEYPATLRIIEIASEYALKNGSGSVKQINLVVGDYSGYVSDSIELYFELIAQETVCKDARLDITRIKPMLRCTSCTKLFKRRLYSFECPFCGGEGQPTEIGKEFYIKSIKI